MPALESPPSLSVFPFAAPSTIVCACAFRLSVPWATVTVTPGLSEASDVL